MSTESESKLKTLTSKVEYLRASNTDGVCVIEGTASWCPQCKAIAPEVEKMTSEFPDARFYKFDVDEVLPFPLPSSTVNALDRLPDETRAQYRANALQCPDIAQELGVSVMPTFTIFKDGDVQEGVSGAKAKDLRDKIKKNLE